jgi:hypothetical protein
MNPIEAEKISREGMRTLNKKINEELKKEGMTEEYHGYLYEEENSNSLYINNYFCSEDCHHCLDCTEDNPKCDNNYKCFLQNEDKYLEIIEKCKIQIFGEGYEKLMNEVSNE